MEYAPVHRKEPNNTKETPLEITQCVSVITLIDHSNMVYTGRSMLRNYLVVEYLDQCLGAAHTKRWSKYAFLRLFVLKS